MVKYIRGDFMKKIPKYKFYFIVSFIFLVVGIIFIQLLYNAISTLILFGYFFLYYLGTAIYHLVKERNNEKSSINLSTES
jgi:uncharacterized membrane protein YhhN